MRDGDGDLLLDFGFCQSTARMKKQNEKTGGWILGVSVSEGVGRRRNRVELFGTAGSQSRRKTHALLGSMR